MKKFSKLVALILAISMVFSMLPVFASAEEEIAETETVETVEAAEEAEETAEPVASTEEETAEEAPAAEDASAGEETEEAVSEESEAVAEASEEEAAAAETTEEVTLQPEEQEEQLVGDANAWRYIDSTGATVGDYATLKDAYAAFTTDGSNLGLGVGAATGTLQLLADYTVASTDNYDTTYTLKGTPKNITFDLNGHTLTCYASTYFIYTFTDDLVVTFTSSAAEKGTLVTGSKAFYAVALKGAGAANVKKKTIVNFSNLSITASNTMIACFMEKMDASTDNCVINMIDGGYAFYSIQGATNWAAADTAAYNIAVKDTTYSGPQFIYLHGTANGSIDPANVTASMTISGTNSFGYTKETANFGCLFRPGASSTKQSFLDTSTGLISAANPMDKLTITTGSSPATAVATSYYVSWDTDGDNEADEGPTQVAYNASPSHEAPTLAGYEFVGWTDVTHTIDYNVGDTLPTMETSGSVTYKARFTAVSGGNVPVKFVDEDGTTVLQAATDVEVGERPVYSAAEPTKATDASYFYTFSGWTKDGEQTHATGDLPPVTQSEVDAGETVTYTAVYTPATTPWYYISANDTPSYHATLKEAFAAYTADLANLGTGANGTAGTLKLMADYTVTTADQVDAVDGSSYVLFGITKNLMIDLNGHTMTDNTSLRFSLLDTDGVVLTVTSSAAERGTYEKTAAAGSVLRFGGGASSAAEAVQISATAEFCHVNITTSATYMFSSNVQETHLHFDDCDITDTNASQPSIQWNKGNNWVDAADANVVFDLSFTDTNFTSNTYITYLKPNVSGYTPNSVNATITLAGTNTFKYKTEQTYNGFVLYNAHGSANRVSAINEENGHVASAPVGQIHQIVLGDEADGSGYYTNTTLTGTVYTVSWDADADGVAESSEPLMSSEHPSHADPVKEGYYFVGWTDGNENYGVGVELPCPTANVTYTAVFTPKAWEYVDANSASTYYDTLKDAFTAYISDLANLGTGANGTAGTLKLRANYSVAADDNYADNATYTLNGIAKNLTIDLGGFTLTDATKRHFILADQDNAVITVKSSAAGKGTFTKTAGGNLVRITGTNNSATTATAQIDAYVVLDNVNVTTTTSNVFYGVAQRTHVSINDSNVTSSSQVFSLQGTNKWSGEQAAVLDLSFTDSTVQGSYIAYLTQYNNSATAASRTATVTLGGENTFKYTDSSVASFYGFPYYATNSTRVALIDPANGYVVEQTAPSANVINLPADAVDGTYTITTSIATANTVTYTDYDDSTIDVEYVANGGTPSHADPTRAGNASNVYTFAGWLKNGTGEPITDLSTETVTGNVTYKASYDSATTVASYTSAAETPVTTYYATFYEAYRASQADDDATASNGGVIKLLQNVTMSVGGEGKDSKDGVIDIAASSKAINLDFNGKTLTNDSGVRFVVVWATSTGAPADITLNFYSSAASKGTLVQTTAVLIRMGTSSANPFKATGVPIAPNVTFENLNITAGSPSSIVQSYLISGTTLFKDCVVNASTISVNGVFAYQMSSSSNAAYRASTADYNLILQDTSVVSGGTTVYFANRIATGVYLDFNAKLVLKGTNTFTYPTANSNANKQTIYGALNGSNVALIGSDYASSGESGYVPYISNTATVGDNTVITVTKISAHTVTWHLLDGTTTTTLVIVGDAPTAPSYSIANLDRFDGWSLTENGDVIDLAEQTIEADEDYYMIGVMLKAASDFKTEEEKNGYIALTMNDTTVYGTSFTSLYTRAMGNTATIKLYKDVELGTEGEAGNGGSYNWLNFTNGTNLTLDLNGHTLQGTTDSENAGYDRTLITFATSSNLNAVLTVSNGTLKTSGGRHILALGGSGSNTAANLSLTATNVTFARTGAPIRQDGNDGTTMLIGVYAPGNTAYGTDPYVLPVRVSFTGCTFVSSGAVTPAGKSVDKAVQFNARTTTGKLPTTTEFVNCNFTTVPNIVDFGNAGGTRPNVKIDAATAANMAAAGGNISTEILLDGDNFATGKAYELNPFTYAESTYTPDFEFVSYSMILDDIVYPQFQISNTDEATFKYVVKAEEDTAYKTAVTVSDTDSETKLASISVSDLGFKAKDSDKEFSITAYKADGSTVYVASAAATINQIVDATNAAAADPNTSIKGAAQLATAMSAMRSYNDWAAYYSYGYYGEDVIAEAPTAVEAISEETLNSYVDMKVEGKGDNLVEGKPGAYGTSAVLGDQLYLKFYFYQMDADAVTVTDSTDVEVDPSKVTTGYDTDAHRFAIVKVTMAPKDYMENYKATIGGSSITASIAGYVKKLLSTEQSENVQNTAYAMIRYCENVAAYVTARDAS